eukprot:4432664-Pyramimonas_sp.AAC.2
MFVPGFTTFEMTNHDNRFNRAKSRGPVRGEFLYLNGRRCWSAENIHARQPESGTSSTHKVHL